MDDITRNLSQAYLQVLGLGKKEEAVTEDQVIAEEELDEAKMDPVDKKALKKDFKDREDKDIDNDGDEDESDEYLHNRRKAISKAVKEETSLEEFTEEELDDFMVSEEFEQLDEISQGLLRRYHGAAASDLQKRREKLARGTMTTQDHKAGQRRVAGLNRAANKMEATENDYDQGVTEAGPFSYGAKKPRKGSVAYDVMMRRKEQEKNRKPIEPKDQMVGVAKVKKGVEEATENEIKYGRYAGMLIDRVQEAKDPKAGATPPQTYGDNASQNTKDFVDMHKAEVSHDAEKANLQNFKDFTAKVKVAKKRPNDNSAGDTKVVK